jgi:hypothetical protein
MRICCLRCGGGELAWMDEVFGVGCRWMMSGRSDCFAVGVA